jgi:hypothetical protein
MDTINKTNTYAIPDLLAGDTEKSSDTFGLQMCHFIESEWFNGGITNTNCLFMTRRDWIREKRLFNRGQGDPADDKTLMDRNSGDLQYLNLDWQHLNLSQKFVRIVSNGINDNYYNLDIRAFDPTAVKMRQEKVDMLKTAMYSKPMLERAKEMGMPDLVPQGFVPEDEEELELYMQIKDRPKIEIAEEILINYIKKTNDWDYIEKEKNKDLVECGLCSGRVYTDKNDGIKVEYIDIESYGHSFVKKNNFKDAFYHFYVDTISINDIKRESGFSEEKLREIAKTYNASNNITWDVDYGTCNIDRILGARIHVMRFCFKSAKKITYKKTTNKNGQVVKISKRDASYSPPEEMGDLAISKVLDTWYEGSYIVGSNYIYDYKECENLVRDDQNKALAPFITRATNIYNNQLHSFLADIQPVCKQLQRQHLKVQQLIAELKPDLIEIDLDSLADLTATKGNNKKKNWEIALSLLNTKGVIIKKRVDMGEMGMKDTAGARPIGNDQGSALIPLLNTWAKYYNLIQELTGVNPARDGSLSEDSLVGVNQMALLASNTATQHIVDAATDFNKRCCEVMSSRIHAIFKYDNNGYLKKIYENALGKYHLNAIEIMADRSLHEFGFSVEMVPAKQEMEEFVGDLNLALQEGNIDVEDKMEAQKIAKTNIKLAREYLKYRRKKRIKQRMEEQQAMAQEKSQNDIAAAQAATQAKTQAYAMQKQIDMEFEQKMSTLRLGESAQQHQIDAPSKQIEFEQDVYLEKIKSITSMELNRYKEDQKDKRQDVAATQRSKMISQTQQNGNPIDFEAEFDFNQLFKQ